MELGCLYFHILAICWSDVKENRIGNFTLTNNGSMFNYYSNMSNLDRSLSAANLALRRDEVDNGIHIGYYYGGFINADSNNLPGRDSFVNAQFFNNFTSSVNNATAGDGITLITITGILHPTLASNNDASQIQTVGSGCLLLVLVTGDDQNRRSGNTDGSPLNKTGAEGEPIAFELYYTGLAPVKAASIQAQPGPVVRFKGAARPFTLPMKTDVQPHTFDLIPDAYPFHRRSQGRFNLLSISCLDKWGNNVADGFSADKIRADITLAKGNDLICTFLHERTAIKTDDAYRFHLLIVVK